MITSPELDKILPALFQAKKEIKPVKKNDTNLHFSHAFANIEAIIEATAPILLQHGLFFTHTLCVLPDGSSGLHTTLWHAASGQYLRGEMPLLLAKEDPQGQGSAMTYARRYAEQAFLDLVTADDDGNQGTQSRQNHQQRSSAPRQQSSNKPPCIGCGSVQTVMKSQYGPGWYCNKKTGGCGAKFEDGDNAFIGSEPQSEEDKELARIFNE